MKFIPWSARAVNVCMDISNLMKPALARGELSCIGCTTLDEHRKYFEKDPALNRRFQPIIVEEPTEEEAVEILFGIRHKFEYHHNCKFTDEAIRESVRISSRYISDRFLPDKAIDLMDEAGSRAKMLSYEKRQKDVAEAKRDWKRKAGKKKSSPHQTRNSSVYGKNTKASHSQRTKPPRLVCSRKLRLCENASLKSPNA